MTGQKKNRLSFVAAVMAAVLYRLCELTAIYFLAGFVYATIAVNGDACLPEFTKTALHDDWIIFKSVPRRWTFWCFDGPPVMLAGNQDYWAEDKKGDIGPKPIPPPGRWQLSAVRMEEGGLLYLPYFAYTSRGGFHFSFGCRWDDVDDYYVFPRLAFQRTNPKKE